MVLLDYVVQVFALPDFYSPIILIVEPINAGFIGATLVDIDFTRLQPIIHYSVYF